MGELERFARQTLAAEYPYLILDARYEKVREEGVIRSRAVLVAIGIDWEGRRRILGVELASREEAPRVGGSSCSGSRRAVWPGSVWLSATTIRVSSGPLPK